MATTIEMLFAHVSGGPVLDEQRRYVESISQFDILKALEAGEDLNSLTAVELMIRDSIRGHDHAHGRQALTERLVEKGRMGRRPMPSPGTTCSVRPSVLPEAVTNTCAPIDSVPSP